MHLAEAHRPEEIRGALSLSLRDVLELDERSAPDAAAKLYGPIVALVKRSSPELGTAIEWLVSNQPAALMDLPLTPALIDAVQGNTDPRSALQLRFAHLIDLGGSGFCAFVMWDTEARLNREERAALVGYIRNLADTAVAPWNRYGDLKRRREAFAVWVRQLRAERVEAERLADAMRLAHPSDYVSEAWAKTVKRIYRISSDLGSVQLPPSLVRMVRDARVS